MLDPAVSGAHEYETQADAQASLVAAPCCPWHAPRVSRLAGRSCLSTTRMTRMTRPSLPVACAPMRRRSLPLGQGEAAEGEEASATEGVEAADATMPDGTPLTAEYSFQEVFAEYRTRNETFLESLEVELRSLPPARHCDTEGAFLA